MAGAGDSAGRPAGPSEAGALSPPPEPLIAELRLPLDARSTVSPAGSSQEHRRNPPESTRQGAASRPGASTRSSMPAQGAEAASAATAQASADDAVALTLWAPARGAPKALLFCLPGGGMTRGYFDLRVPGNDSHSFARAMTARGYLVAALDHPGTGDSGADGDLYRHTPERLARAAAEACRQLCALSAARPGGPAAPGGAAGLPAGWPAMAGLPVVGVGHSMGAMVAILAQVSHSPFAALALLGFGTRGLPQYLPEAVRAELQSDRAAVVARQVELARAMFGSAAKGAVDRKQEQREQARRNEDLFGRGNAEADGVRALAACAAPILPVPAFRSMLPGNIAEAAAAVDVPIFLALGEKDLAGPPHATPGAFTGSGDVTLHILPGAGHSHFLFPARHGLFDRLAFWAAGIVPRLPPAGEGRPQGGAQRAAGARSHPATTSRQSQP